MAERWPRNLDGFLLGALAGLAGTSVQFLLELFVVAFIPSYKSCVRLAAAMLVEPAAAMTRFDAFLLGFELNLMVGAVVGVVAVQILSAWGRDHLLLKGATGGALVWLLCYGTFARFLSGLDLRGTVFLETQISLAVHLVFGMAVAAAAVAIERRWPAKGEKGNG